MLELVRDYWHIFLLYAPLAAVGVWRWSVWLVQRIIASRYRSVPEKPGYCPTLTIITPIYNAESDVFRASLYSWLQNGPDEIIAVIDQADTENIAFFRDFQREFAGARLIIEEKQGKRAALHDGILEAKGEIVALVDDDTMWDADIKGKLLAPFFDPQVGAVAPRQKVIEGNTLARRLFSIHLDVRYGLEYQFLSVVGHALHCLSGRTALYRRTILQEVAEELVQERFMGQLCVSGDDKCLTRLTEERAWNTAYQGDAVVRTPGMARLGDFIKQSIRWARNMWRSDIQMMLCGWIWKRERGLALFLADKFLVIFVVWLGPVYFVSTILIGHYHATLILLAWWLLSRTIKLWPHLREHRGDITLVPLYLFESYVSSLLKLYALFTIRRQGWMTRWDKNRLTRIRHVFLNDMAAYAAVFLVVGGVAYGSVSYRRYTFDSYLSVAPAGSVTIDISDDIQTLGFPPQRKIVRTKDGYAVTYRKKVEGVYQPFVAFVEGKTGGFLRVTGIEEPIARLPLTQRVASLAADATGVVHAAFYGGLTDGAEEDRQISHARHDRKLSGWSKSGPVSVVAGFDGEDEWQEHPYVTAFGDLNLYAIWEGRDETNKKPQIKFSRSTDGGEKWTAWMNISPKSGVAQSRPQILAGFDGKLHVLAYITPSGEPARVAHSESADNGSNWTPFRTVSDGKFDARHISAVMDKAGVIYAVYRSATEIGAPQQIQLVKLESGKWSKPKALHRSDSEQLFPSLSLLEDGRALVVWSEHVEPLGYPELAAYEEVRAGIMDGAVFSLLTLAFHGSFPSVPEYASREVPLLYSLTTPTSTAVMLRMLSL